MAVWESAGRQEVELLPHVDGGQSRPLLYAVCSVLIFLLQGPHCGTEPYANAT